MDARRARVTARDAARALFEGGDADRVALLVRTRCVRVAEDEVAMVPGIDALNDASGRAASSTTLTNRSLRFEMVAERDIGQGEEVTHAYDDVVDAADYLERYGFAPVITTCCSKVFTVEDIVEASQNDRRRRSVRPCWPALEVEGLRDTIGTIARRPAERYARLCFAR